MSNRNNFISFDASIVNNVLGIGIYDNLTSTHYHYKTNYTDNCTKKAETIALGCALLYAQKINRTKLNLYTDNKGLADSGIPNQYTHLVQNKEYNLRWIPREMNKEADAASKGKTVDAGSSVITSKANLEYDNSLGFRNLSCDSKIKLLERVKKTKGHSEIIRMLKTGTKGNYNFQNSNQNSIFLRLVFTIFDESELSIYSFNSLNKALRDEKTKTLNKAQIFKHFV